MNEQEWVRNHRTAGLVVGRFAEEETGRELLVIRTLSGPALVPHGSTITIDKAYMIRQAALDLGPIIETLLTVGLTIDDAQQAWQQAVESVTNKQPTT